MICLKCMFKIINVTFRGESTGKWPSGYAEKDN